MNISFTREEISSLWAEICMVVDAADECIEKGYPRPDDAILRRLKGKLEQAHTEVNLTPEARRIVNACKSVQRKLLRAANPGEGNAIMCDTCSQYPASISREEFANAIQTPTCPECGRVVPADEAWQVYPEPAHRLPEPAPEIMVGLAELDQ